jgi:hypothetical protein
MGSDDLEKGLADMNRDEAARSRDKGRRLVRRVTSWVAAGGLAVAAGIGITAGISQQTNVSTTGSTSSTTDSSSSISSSTGSSGSSGSMLQSTQAPALSNNPGAVTSGGS